MIQGAGETPGVDGWGSQSFIEKEFSSNPIFFAFSIGGVSSVGRLKGGTSFFPLGYSRGPTGNQT